MFLSTFRLSSTNLSDSLAIFLSHSIDCNLSATLCYIEPSTLDVTRYLAPPRPRDKQKKSLIVRCGREKNIRVEDKTLIVKLRLFDSNPPPLLSDHEQQVCILFSPTLIVGLGREKWEEMISFSRYGVPPFLFTLWWKFCAAVCPVERKWTCFLVSE